MLSVSPRKDRFLHARIADAMLKEGRVLFSFRRLLEPLRLAIGLKGGKQCPGIVVRSLHWLLLGTETREESAAAQCALAQPRIFTFGSLKTRFGNMEWHGQTKELADRWFN